MDVIQLAPLILVFPIIGIFMNALFGRRFVDADRRVGERWSGWFASIMALASFGVAVLLLIGLAGNEFHAETVRLFDWISIPSANFYIPWAIQVDTLSVTMMLVVAGVSSLIHIYAIGYMHGDPDFSRFFTYLNLFVFFMLTLVSGSSYLMLFVGWEGVGLCSFLLIGFWFDRVDADKQPMNANAARKAFVANRVGDFAMVLAMVLMFWTFGSLQFNTVFGSAVEMFEAGHVVEFGLFQAPLASVLTAVTALFLMGAAGKSAQIPLYVWLPDAMAGPTPVSALIHAATMVTSGVYLIVRSNVLFEIVRESGALIFGIVSSPDLVAYIGAATALLAGLIAFTQNDIKKVLAYSTVSQLGFMVAAAGMGAYVAAMFHLTTHAFFKALLFLSSGSVIHGMEHGHHHIHEHSQVHPGEHDPHAEAAPFDPQDMRTMGGLRQRMPVTFVVYMIGTLALAGIVPLAGFWSKDEILAHASYNSGTVFSVVSIMLTIAAFCTAFYMGRQIKMVFFGKPRHEAAEHAQESSPLMTVPLMILAGLTILGGLLNLPYGSKAAYEAAKEAHETGIFLALEHWLEHSIAAFVLTEEGLLHLPHTPTWLQINVAAISTVLAVAGLLLAFFVVYGRKPERAEDPDPLPGIPVIGPLIWWFRILPLNTLYMKGIIPLFNRLAAWLAGPLDSAFWHDFVHERLVRDTFVGFANFASDVFDARGVDGIVNGTARVTGRVANVLRVLQTGYVRNYALALFLGVIALLVYFVFAAG
ncbi:MAG: NADH-quinone oxidoreductase subunit L [Ardenticatenaceae bacterium]|nr:NADH-quinone oxidoreductase subunit L [Anaerolineales bacterium]MCB8917440.1 NADH-quinone oxidoreductase subunit L [Ardenticatenaceae bacterium]